MLNGHETCYCGHVYDEHGDDRACEIAGCDCTMFDEDEETKEVGLPERAASPSASADLAPDVAGALEIIERFGSIDGDHHKTWVIDQVVRKLLGKGYAAWLVDMKDGEDGPNTYDEWDEGIAP